MSVLGEDDISHDLALPLLGRRIYIDEECLRIKPLEIGKGGPVVRGFREGLTLNVEYFVDIKEREASDHLSPFVPTTKEAMPQVSLWEATSSSPDFFINCS